MTELQKSDIATAKNIMNIICSMWNDFEVLESADVYMSINAYSGIGEITRCAAKAVNEILTGALAMED